MPTSGADSTPPARPRPSRYESQKRRDWQTFTRYLAAHRPPLELRQCSGAHVLEFLRYLDRFGKTRVHAPPCPGYGGGRPVVATSSSSLAAPGADAAEPCPCPLRQAWGSLDALVGRLCAAFDERHGARGSVTTTAAAAAAAQQPENAAGGANPFAARAVRLYLRDVRDAQARARGISYSRKKKRRSKQQGITGASAASASSKEGGGARPHGESTTTLMVAPAVPPPHLHPNHPPLPPAAYLAGVPFEYCDYYGSSGVLGGGGAPGNGAAGFYLPLLFNTFG